ncbi:MAG: hypothetical protein HND56_12820 [Pseudomonadota bacterium]|nr:MAG: hypothetical protein HND56_12820 [Pseudomonadota bacterium]
MEKRPPSCSACRKKIRFTAIPHCRKTCRNIKAAIYRPQDEQGRSHRSRNGLGFFGQYDFDRYKSKKTKTAQKENKLAWPANADQDMVNMTVKAIF